ncbi:MAG: hypothetical protein ACRD1V_11180 [Vicinamibacterales bacterium]
MSTSTRELPGPATRASETRTIRVGLPGLGNVGSAVARAVEGEARSAFIARGFAPTITQALIAYGIWCTRLTRRGDHLSARSCVSSAATLDAALTALRAATGAAAAALPALMPEEAAC